MSITDEGCFSGLPLRVGNLNLTKKRCTMSQTDQKKAQFDTLMTQILSALAAGENLLSLVNSLTESGVELMRPHMLEIWGQRVVDWVDYYKMRMELEIAFFHKKMPEGSAIWESTNGWQYCNKLRTFRISCEQDLELLKQDLKQAVRDNLEVPEPKTDGTVSDAQEPPKDGAAQQ